MTSFLVVMEEVCAEERKADDEPLGYLLRVSLSIRLLIGCVLDFFKGGDGDVFDDDELSLDKLCWWSRFKRIDEFVPLVRDIHK